MSGLLALILLLLPARLGAAAGPEPKWDAWTVPIGTQTFDGKYHFTTNTLLVETAEAIYGRLGSDILKLYLGPNTLRQYGLAPPAQVTNLVTLARDEPSFRRVFDMPFRHVIAWTYAFSSPDAAWRKGYHAKARADEYREIYDLTQYLLTTYANSGKTFYLGHWEGDWLLLGSFNAQTNPPAVAVQGMIDWLSNRQQAIDDAKRDTPHHDVEVLGYAEVNRVRDAMPAAGPPKSRVINAVVPYVKNLDCLSWSSYDGANLSPAELRATLDYLQRQIPPAKARSVSGSRIWIGEYGWGHLSFDQQEPLTRAYIQRLLPWGPRFILFWEIYNNEPGGNFSLIDTNNELTPCGLLHQRLIRQSRQVATRFRETHGRWPTAAEFSAAISPLLDPALPATRK